VTDFPALRTANTNRILAAGKRDAVLLSRALEVLGDQCPPHYREVAEARISAPGESWSVIATRLRMNKDTAVGCKNRLLALAGVNGS
jgi:DNA-binding transcriptional regulator WhiA